MYIYGLAVPCTKDTIAVGKNPIGENRPCATMLPTNKRYEEVPMADMHADISVNPQDSREKHPSGKTMLQVPAGHPYDLKLQGGVL